MTEEDMHTFRLAFVCAFAGAVMAFNVASLHAAPLPTNVAAMKSTVADSLIQVRWGGWRGGGWGYRGFGGGFGYRGLGWGAGALAGAVIGGAIASSAYGYYGGPAYGYYPGYSYYPAYVGYSPYYDYGPWQAIQEPGAARFYRPDGYGWRPWGYW
jgi:hypothetical protein